MRKDDMTAGKMAAIMAELSSGAVEHDPTRYVPIAPGSATGGNAGLSHGPVPFG